MPRTPPDEIARRLSPELAAVSAATPRVTPVDPAGLEDEDPPPVPGSLERAEESALSKSDDLDELSAGGEQAPGPAALTAPDEHARRRAPAPRPRSAPGGFVDLAGDFALGQFDTVEQVLLRNHTTLVSETLRSDTPTQALELASRRAAYYDGLTMDLEARMTAMLRKGKQGREGGKEFDSLEKRARGTHRRGMDWREVADRLTHRQPASVTIGSAGQVAVVVNHDPERR